MGVFQPGKVLYSTVTSEDSWNRAYVQHVSDHPILGLELSKYKISIVVQLSKYNIYVWNCFSAPLVEKNGHDQTKQVLNVSPEKSFK